MAGKDRPAGGVAAGDPESARRSRALADAQEEAEANPRDETVEGGRYVVGGRVVNAENEQVKDGGRVSTRSAPRASGVFTGTQPPPPEDGPEQPSGQPSELEPGPGEGDGDTGAPSTEWQEP